LPNDTKTVFDFGSGGGFPGMVLAIMRPDIDFSLVESDQKKCSFLLWQYDLSQHVSDTQANAKILVFSNIMRRA